MNSFVLCTICDLCRLSYSSCFIVSYYDNRPGRKNAYSCWKLCYLNMVLLPLRDSSLSICIRAEQELFQWRICPECWVATRVWRGLVIKLSDCPEQLACLWLSMLTADCCLHVGWSFHNVTECWISKGELLNVILLSHRCHRNEGQWIQFVWMI